MHNTHSISQSALISRINRKLSSEGVHGHALRVNRQPSMYFGHGLVVVDLNHNTIEYGGRELGVLRDGEVLS